MQDLNPTKGQPPFQEFYSTYYEKVVFYIRKKIFNAFDAEDLASEIFLYCYSHYDDYDPQKSSLSTWLYLIVNSRIKNHYRDAKPNIDLEALVGVLHDDRVDMDECVYLEQMKWQLERAMGKLTVRQRQIVKMRYFEEKTNAEIADLLGMTRINIRVQLSRALDILEKYVEL